MNMDQLELPPLPTQPPAAASAIQESRVDSITPIFVLAVTRARVFKLLTQSCSRKKFSNFFFKFTGDMPFRAQMTNVYSRNLFQKINSASLCSLAGRYSVPSSHRLFKNSSSVSTVKNGKFYNERRDRGGLYNTSMFSEKV